MDDGTAFDAELSPAMLVDPTVYDTPWEFFARLRRAAPVWLVPGTSIVTVSSFAALQEAVGRPQDFSSHLTALLYRDETGQPATTPFGDDNTQVLATADPPVHATHRAAVLPRLAARRMADLRPFVDQLTTAKLDAALGSGAVEFMGSVANAVPIRVVSRLVGWENEDPDALLAAAFASTEILAASCTLDQIHAAMERTAVVGGWIAEQAVAAIAAPAEGLLGDLARAVNDDQIGVMDAIVILHTLLSAGGESTTGLIGNAVYLLARDTELQQRLRDDPTMMSAFIEEVMRLESPFQYHLRSVPQTTQLQGVTIHAGSTMALLWGAANRDPAEYDRPDTVDLTRSAPRHHVGFGRGIHLCVGAPLARLEAQVVLTQLLERTRTFTLDPATPPRREPSLMIRRFATLPLLVEPAA